MSDIAVRFIHSVFCGGSPPRSAILFTGNRGIYIQATEAKQPRMFIEAIYCWKYQLFKFFMIDVELLIRYGNDLSKTIATSRA